MINYKGDVSMIYVGIDVAKLNHCASFVDSDGVILVEPFEFQNNHSGFQTLLKHLTSFSREDLLIGMESTAHYAENLTCFLYTRGFHICIINPIQTSVLRKGKIRKTKTDSEDTYLISKALKMEEYRIFTEQDYNSLQLKGFKKYRFEKLSITLEDIEKLVRGLTIEKEPTIPFPQADNFERIINLCELLYKKNLTKTDITTEYGFDKRQTDYYVNAGRYLGLIKDSDDKSLTLTKLGCDIMGSTPTQKQLKFAESILKHSVFHEVLKQQLKTGNVLSKKEIIGIMKHQNLFKVESEETYSRRASTINSWIDWITSLTSI